MVENLVSIAGVLGVACLAWPISLRLQRSFWPDVYLPVIIVCATIATALALACLSDWWVKQQPTPIVSIVNGFRPGSPVTVDVSADPNQIHRVEVLATIRKRSKNYEGKTRTTNVRVTAQDLDVVPVDDRGDGRLVRYSGVVPQLDRRHGVTWFISVHLFSERGFRYARPFPVLVSQDEAKPESNSGY